MLVLTRKPKEAIVIGENIRVHVIQVQGERVRLAIEAPTEVPVHREEVYEAIRRERLLSRRAKRDAETAQAGCTDQGSAS